jgi:hypothetical protein
MRSCDWLCMEGPVMVVCVIAALVTIGLTLTSFGDQTMSAATRPERNFAVEVLSILNIKDNGSDVLPLLADALEKQDGDAVAFGKSISRLVDGLLAGPSPTILVDKILPTVHIEYETGFQLHLKDWKYGTRESRRQLSKKLWELAEAAQSKDAKRSREMATAVFVFAALDYYQLDWRELTRIIGRNGSDLKSKELLELTDDQFKRLQEVVRGEQQRLETLGNESMKANEAVDRIAGAPDKPMDADMITKEVLSHLDRAYREGPSQSGCRWGVISDAWDLLNLARSIHDEAIQQLVRQQLEKWKRDYPDTNTDRWIDEALARQAAPWGGKRVAHYIQLSDGRIVPDDGKIVPKEPPDSSK